MTTCSEKICSSCKETKLLTLFPKNKNFKTGYNSRCKVCINKINKGWRTNSRDKYLSYRKREYYDNFEAKKDQRKAYNQKRRKEKSQYDINYRKKNKEKIKKYKKAWEDRNKNNPIFKIKRNLRRRVHHALMGNNKSKSTFELIGCSPEEFKIYIESLWLTGMSWDNYDFYGWHIDHIIPCYKFDLSKSEEQIKCFHYTNQRPLWAKDNLSRSRE